MDDSFGDAIQPRSWVTTAFALITAAERSLAGPPLAEESERAGQLCVYAMLAGLAIENLVKGWLHECDARHMTTVADGRLQKDIPGHALTWFVERTGMPLRPQDEELLRALQQAVVWSGRYPVAKTRTAHDVRRPTPSLGTVRSLLRRLTDHLRAPDKFDRDGFETAVAALADRVWVRPACTLFEEVKVGNAVVQVFVCGETAMAWKVPGDPQDWLGREAAKKRVREALPSLLGKRAVLPGYWCATWCRGVVTLEPD